MLQVRLLGQFDVRVDSQPAVISSRAGQSLLAYLMATAGTPHRREKLAGLFWPDTLDENARARLRHELWGVRKAISAAAAAADFIVADELTITFNPEAEYSLDVAQLEQELPADASLDERVRQAGLYHGELLPGFYDEWIVLERARVQAVFERRMQQLLECLIDESRWKMTLEWSERWLAFGEMPEPAYRAMMLAYSALGDRSKVAATYDRCVALLAQELDVAPSEETTSLRDRLLRGEGVARIDLSATHVASAQSRSFNEPPTPGEPPFKGLQAFEEADADRFFGRELLTAQLIGRLRESRFLAVIVGASGSGKSSIVRAGLIPQLKRGELLADGTLPPADSSHWQIHVITPTAHPLEALAVSLTRGTESVTAAATLAEDLARDVRSLRLFVRRSLEASSGAQHLLLVVDQFEELFTLCRNEFEREAFIDNLIAALEPDTGGGLTLVLTLRADFYAHLASYPELRDAVARQQEYIGPMTVEELRRAIEEPAKLGGWDFQPGLVDVLLRDVGDEPGALPLLSHALLETWQRRSGRTLTLQGYAETGGVRGAIAHTAETVYQALPPEQQPLARHIFLRLTELGEGTEDTRRRASLQELMAQSDQAGEVRAVLNTLAQARLITLSEETAEVAHEALIRAWPTLRDWLNADREGLILHRRLTEAAYDWELLERDPGALYRGARLAQAAEWAAANPAALNALEQIFLTASQEREQHEAVEREVQRRRELEQARQLAETERARADSEQRRAEEQTQSANRLRTRNRALAIAGALVTVAAIVVIIFGGQANANASRADQNAAQAQTNLNAAQANAATAEAARVLASNNASAAEVARNNAVNARATAVAEAQIRATQQAIAQANFTHAEAQRLAAEANRLLLGGSNAELAALLSLRSMNTQYTSQGDSALSAASRLDYPEQTIVGSSPAHGTAISPDGKYLVIGREDHSVRLYDVKTGKEIRQFVGQTGRAGSIAYSPDGKYIASGSSDNTARVWDAATGQEVRQFTSEIGVTFSPDGKYVLGGTPARIWEVATGEEVRQFISQSGATSSVAFSHDGKSIVTGNDDGTTIQWDAQTGREMQRFTGHKSAVNIVRFSPDDKFVLTGSEDETARLWDSATGKELQRFTGHTNIVESVAFSPDGKTVFTASGDDTRVWDRTTGQELGRFPSGTPVYDLAISPDGESIWTVSGDGIARLWGIKPKPVLPLFQDGDVVNGVAFSSDGKFILTGDSKGIARLWNASTGQLLREFIGHTDLINYGVAFFPDGKKVVTSSWDKTVRIWDSGTGQELYRFMGHTDKVNDVAISPDGKYILSTGFDSMRIWDSETGQEVRHFGEGSPLFRAVFSPDGKYIAATRDSDAGVQLWDAMTGKMLQHFTATAGMFGVVFSPDSKYLLGTDVDGIAWLWDIQTRKMVRQFLGHTRVIGSADFSPDGKSLATASYDGTARLWDAQTGQELRRYTGNTSPVENVVFSPDGKFILTGGDDGTARLWDVDYHTTMANLCSHLRDFTDDERAQYGIPDTTPTCPKL